MNTNEREIKASETSTVTTHSRPFADKGKTTNEHK
jgi:hypothetical protein